MLSAKIYESNWVGLIHDRNCSQIVLFMMEDLKREYIIFIGKIFPLRLATFASVCRYRLTFLLGISEKMK